MKIFHFVPTEEAIANSEANRAMELDPKLRIEFHIVQPGNWFIGFGGSRHGLQVKKTASIISRVFSTAGGQRDTEWDANDPEVWAWIRRCLRNPVFKQVVETREEEEV